MRDEERVKTHVAEPVNGALLGFEGALLTEEGIGARVVESEAWLEVADGLEQTSSASLPGL